MVTKTRSSLLSLKRKVVEVEIVSFRYAHKRVALHKTSNKRSLSTRSSTRFSKSTSSISDITPTSSDSEETSEEEDEVEEVEELEESEEVEDDIANRVERRPRGIARTDGPKYVELDGIKMKVSPVHDCLYRFIVERHRVHQRRMAGQPPPWTDDPILSNWPFVNVYRCLDRTSQYILREVINKGSPDLRETCFRVILFRLFNRISTWELLKDCLGDLTWQDFNIDTYEKILHNAFANNQALYSGAYIIPAPKLGHPRLYGNSLRLVYLMMSQDLPKILKGVDYLFDAHVRISLFPSMGEFTALQLLLDLNMSPHFNFSEDEWVPLGPGSKECIKRIFGQEGMRHQQAAIKYLHSTQYSHFARLGLTKQIPWLSGGSSAGLTLVDLEHAMCECAKYARSAFPDSAVKRKEVSNRQFAPNPNPLTADIPRNRKVKRQKPRLTYPPPAVGKDYYEVSYIVTERMTHGRCSYLVRWTGYGPSDDTWEPLENLQEGAPLVLNEWRSRKARISAAVQAFNLGTWRRSLLPGKGKHR